VQFESDTKGLPGALGAVKVSKVTELDRSKLSPKAFSAETSAKYLLDMFNAIDVYIVVPYQILSHGPVAEEARNTA
jgi:hypothetical protein